MKYQVSTLPNKLRVVTADMAGAYSATISVSVGVGSRYEQFDRNGGLSHFLEHLMFKGTHKRPSTKIISEQIDAVGGWNNAYTTNEMTNFYVKVPFQHTELGLDILGDMLTDSLFDAGEIDRERGVVLEEMNVYRDDPASYVHRLTPELLWPGHPLAHEVLGSEEVIRTIKRDDVVAYQQHYYQPGNMVVAAAGRVDHDEMVKLAQRLFGGLSNQPVTAAPAVTTELAPKKVSTFVKDTAQTHLVIGTVAYPYRHPDDAAAKLVATILGRGLSSRLFMNVRERKGLAYTVTAGLDNFVDTGEFEVYAGVNLAKTNDAIEAIIEELQTITTETVGDEELSKAKNQIRGSLQMAMESNSAVADRLGSQLLLLNEIRSIEDTLDEVDAVTPADIKRVAGAMLAPDRLRMGIISPDPEPAATAFTKFVS
jgi:predicted Zn-dependent peptidase